MRLTVSDRLRGLRTERDAAERRDRIVGYGLCVLAVCYGLFELGVAIHQYGEDRAAAEAQQAAAAKAEEARAYKMLADCLNGRALKVRGTNAAIFCDGASCQGGL